MTAPLSERGKAWERANLEMEKQFWVGNVREWPELMTEIWVSRA